MTHFGVLVGLMVGMITLLSAILGGIWRASAGWAKLKDSVENIQKRLVDIIAEKEKAHNQLGERITWLERKAK
jgi:hypothetical protein